MTTTGHLELPYIDAAQSQKHVTHNEALRLLDIVVQLSVVARNMLSAPADPAADARYIVGASATGVFAGYDTQIAAFVDGGWIFSAPQAGWLAYVEQEAVALVFGGTSWQDLGSVLKRVQSLERCGIGTTADATNPLSVKLNSALFAAKAGAEGGSGDLRMVLNKSATANSVSQLYQSNWSGRAETGLTGDDHFHIKVSADGATWFESIDIDPATGIVSFPKGASGIAAGGLTYEWSGTQLRLKGSDGTWGSWVNLIGATGPAPTLSIGTVSTLASGASPTVTCTGTLGVYSLSFGIPASPVLAADIRTALTAAPLGISYGGTGTTSATGSGACVLASSPSLVTPSLGAATATSLAATGAITSSGTGGLGYATGAGGSVTQLTSKATGVTLNKLTGKITLNSATLSSATIVSFVLTNSTLTANDLIVITHCSGGTLSGYSFAAVAAAGSATIFSTGVFSL